MIQRNEIAASSIPEGPRQAVLYARVSSKDQEREGYSIPAQQKLLREYAPTKGLMVVHEFIDVETAKRAGRTGFEEMRAFLAANPACQVILVEKTDRLYRNISDWVTLDVDALNLEVHLVKENVVLGKNARSSEKFMHGIRVLMAKNFIDNLSEEVRKGMLQKAEDGTWPSSAPLGYQNVKMPDGKKGIAPDPKAAPLVTRLFERYATGNYSLKEVTKKGQEEGMVFRRSLNSVPTATVHKLLRNRIYTGDFDWKGKTYSGGHRPLVTRELWERVQKTLDRHCSKGPGRGKHDFPFSGLIACGHCGCALVGEIQKGRYVYYHCTGYKGKCPEPYVRQEVLEKHFSDLLEHLVFDEEVRDWIAEGLRRSHGDQKRGHAEAVTRLQAESNRLQARLDVMYQDKLDGRITTTFFDQRSAEWRAEQARIQRDILEHQQANQAYFEEGVNLLDLARGALGHFRKREASGKRRLLNVLVSNCSWKAGVLSAQFRQPFDMLAVANDQTHASSGAEGASEAISEKWYARRDSNPCLHLERVVS